jgi:hypothetical protein
VFVGLNKIDQFRNLTIYPQPWNNGLLHIDGILEPADFYLSDISGRVVFSTNLSANQYQQIQIPTLSSGIYFIKIQTGDSSTSRLFVVK